VTTPSNSGFSFEISELARLLGASRQNLRAAKLTAMFARLCDAPLPVRTRALDLLISALHANPDCAILDEVLTDYIRNSYFADNADLLKIVVAYQQRFARYNARDGLVRSKLLAWMTGRLECKPTVADIDTVLGTPALAKYRHTLAWVKVAAPEPWYEGWYRLVVSTRFSDRHTTILPPAEVTHMCDVAALGDTKRQELAQVLIGEWSGDWESFRDVVELLDDRVPA
jgi:hypothetical protein